jgi:hypothetical protein
MAIAIAILILFIIFKMDNTEINDLQSPQTPYNPTPAPINHSLLYPSEYVSETNNSNANNSKANNTNAIDYNEYLDRETLQLLYPLSFNQINIILTQLFQEEDGVLIQDNEKRYSLTLFEYYYQIYKQLSIQL